MTHLIELRSKHRQVRPLYSLFMLCMLAASEKSPMTVIFESDLAAEGVLDAVGVGRSGPMIVGGNLSLLPPPPPTMKKF